MACPQETELTSIKICGSIQTVCPTDPTAITVQVDLVNPGSPIIKDPTTGAIVLTGFVDQQTTELGDDGCWCTCALLPNYASGDSLALTPATTGYQIQVVWGNTLVLDEFITVDADGNYPITTNPSCGEGCDDDCANVTTYINGRPPASNPWSWGPYSATNLVDFEAQLTAAGYTLVQFGEKHSICPEFGAFGEDPDAPLDNGIAISQPFSEPNYDPNYVPSEGCGCVDICVWLDAVPVKTTTVTPIRTLTAIRTR